MHIDLTYKGGNTYSETISKPKFRANAGKYMQCVYISGGGSVMIRISNSCEAKQLAYALLALAAEMDE